MDNGSRLQAIADRPTVVNRVHESVYRNWLILDYIEWLLAHNTPPDVVLSIVRDLRALAHKETSLSGLGDAPTP
jgi:hypothetical protein